MNIRKERTTIQKFALVIHDRTFMKHQTHMLFRIQEIGSLVPLVHEGWTSPIYRLFDVSVSIQNDLSNTLNFRN